MIPRKRYGSKNTDQGVYLGLSKTQVLSPATAGSSSSDIAPLPPPVALVPPPPNTMSCRDRTQEFLSACKSLQSRQNGIQTNKPALRAVRQRSEFTLMAKRIGKDLSNTFAKLEKLTILAKRKSLFDDKAVEIEELTYIIKQDINSLNKQIAQLQDFVRAKGSQSGRHLQTHSNTIVVSLQSKLASMSNDFKSVLEVRTERPRDLCISSPTPEPEAAEESAGTVLPGTCVSPALGPQPPGGQCCGFGGRVSCLRGCGH
ncbi:syntaxin-5 isoform X2 [Mustela erminea]|uniref:Syntaxin-5 isoform X3 n=1 Tax=Mustela putorius furo TaxID=9669 RepID=A0A8U0R970_MUSPF|nr:syntaxin-5 isoform X2 [Mustela erminea]XP_044919743.1 syntaxin-5 isoform X3 [Mustela putorius furo]